MNTTFAKNTFCTSLFLLVHSVSGAEMNPGAVDPIPVCETLTTACSRLSHPVDAAAGFEIVFDQSKEQVYSPFDTAFSGMSGLSRLLRSMGGRVSTNSLPLDVFLENYAGAGRVLMLGVAMNQRYSEAEVIAILKFAMSGGGILITAEHDNLFQNADLQNELLRYFGMAALDSDAMGMNANASEAQWPSCFVPDWPITPIYLYLPVPLAVHPPSKPLLRLSEPMFPGENDIVAGIAAYGAGRIVALGDAEILWNMTETSGIRRACNSEFIAQVCLYLAGGRNASSPEESRHEEPPDTGAPTVFFETTGSALGLESTLSGLSRLAAKFAQQGFKIASGGGEGTPYQDYSLVVWACPLVRVSHTDAIRKCAKILVIADGQSDFLRAMPALKQVLAEQFDAKENPSESVCPLNDLTETLGVFFAMSTVVTEAKNHFFVPASWNGALPFELRRATHLVLSEAPLHNGISVLASAETGAWALQSLTPLQSKLAEIKPFQKPAVDLLPPPLPVVAASKRLFAVSDAELLVNQFADSEEAAKTFSEIMRWLND